jgi:hypothetical protein
MMAPMGIRYSRSAIAAKALLRHPHSATAGAILRIAPALSALGVLLPAGSFGAPCLRLGEHQLWAHQLRHP